MVSFDLDDDAVKSTPSSLHRKYLSGVGEQYGLDFHAEFLGWHRQWEVVRFDVVHEPTPRAPP